MIMNIHEKLSKIQGELKVPKNNYNSFGKYKFRNNDDILEAVKPIAFKYGCYVLQNDEMLLIGERYYIKATTSISDGENEISATAYAREDDQFKGMSLPQLSGSTSSYARKYSANGLFALDDNKDDDSRKPQQKKPVAKKKAELTQDEKNKKLAQYLADKTSSIKTKEQFNDTYDNFTAQKWWKDNESFCKNWMGTFKKQLELSLSEIKEIENAITK